MSRILDVVVAGVLLVLVSPLLLAAVVAIRLESRGPAFYRQRRVGRHGVPFELWKLRTMVPGAEEMGAGINYWFTPNFVLKTSVHWVDGNRFAFPDPVRLRAIALGQGSTCQTGRWLRWRSARFLRRRWVP